MTKMVRTKTYCPKAFTLVELAVAVGVLVIMLTVSGAVFRYSIEAYRKANAYAEILEKFRVITQQFDSDFRSWRREGRFLIRYHCGEEDGEYIRSDRLGFFVNGDFQTTRQYEKSRSDDKQTVYGHVAGVLYGQTTYPDPNSFDPIDRRNKILFRRQTILTYKDFDDFKDPNFKTNDGYEDYMNEFYNLCFSQWMGNVPWGTGENPIAWPSWTRRVPFSPSQPENFGRDSVTYLARGVDNFTIQYVGYEKQEYRDTDDLKFYQWRPISEEIVTQDDRNEWTVERRYNERELAVKITFTLYDSKGIFEDGKTFSYIIWRDIE